MPHITAHVHFAHILLHEGGVKCIPYWLVIGSLAPDCFDRSVDGSWRRPHFAFQSADPDPGRFLNDAGVCQWERTPESNALVTGYHAHLWLDKRFSPGGETPPVTFPAGMEKDSVWASARVLARQYDLEVCGELLADAKTESCYPGTVAGLEFIDVAGAVAILRTIVLRPIAEPGGEREDAIMPMADYRQQLLRLAHDYLRDLQSVQEALKHR